MSKKQTDRLLKLASTVNIATSLDDDKLKVIGSKVVEQTRIDNKSRGDWLSLMSVGMSIAKQLVPVQSGKAYINEYNVKLPLIANGAMTFAAREYPQLVRGDKVVSFATFGRDDNEVKLKKADRLSFYHSWQLLVKSNYWEPQTDKLLHMLAVVGTVFRKVYWSDSLQRPMFDLCLPEHIVVNQNVESLESARRVTHILGLSRNAVVERGRSGLYLELEKLESGWESEYERDDKYTDNEDDDDSIVFEERHGYLDLDDDGYEEPYVITVHQKSKQVIRIAPRFNPTDIVYNEKGQVKYIHAKRYFVDYHFIPSPDGSYYSLGFGTLLAPLNETCNSLVNQLLDSGAWSNLQGGFIGAGCRIKGGEIKVHPGKWIKVEGVGGQDLSKNIMPFPSKEPSKTLFELLGLMTEMIKDLASISDILKGDMPTQNSPANTTLALIKQGLVQYNATHKRVLYSLKKEFQLLYDINCENINIAEYIEMCGVGSGAMKSDFDIKDLDVKPVSDPNISSDTVRLMREQAIMQMPAVDHTVASKRMLEAMDVPDVEIKELLPDNPPTPPETQQILAEVELKKQQAGDIKTQAIATAAKLQHEHQQLQQQQHEFNVNVAEIMARVKQLEAQAVLALAQAQAANMQVPVQVYAKELDTLAKSELGVKDAIQNMKEKTGVEPNEDNEGGASAMAQQPTNSAVPGSSQANAGNSNEPNSSPGQ
jgi:chaperonin GroES